MAEGAVIVGGGPCGLAAAVELRRLGVEVTVLEREREAGGIPRHCGHTGFGARDLHRVTSGPKYAARHRELAERSGVELLAETMVTDWDEEGRLGITGPAGRRRVESGAVLLATGCRERPRSARLVPGSRPSGIMTTGTLQQMVYLQGRRKIGERAVVVGAEHVSFSAVASLAHGGASTLGLVTEHPRSQSLAAFRLGAWVRYGTRVWTGSAVTDIRGGDRVEEVEITDLGSGRVRTVACDLVVFSADWIPDHELAVEAGCEVQPGSRGPRTDPEGRTTAPGVFAAGNLVHPAETADLCALAGRRTAEAVAAHVRGDGAWPAQVPMIAHEPLAWVAPSLVVPGGPRPRGGVFLLRSREFLRRPRIEVSQAGIRLWRGRLRRLAPGRSGRLPAGWTEAVDPAGGPIEVRVT